MLGRCDYVLTGVKSLMLKLFKNSVYNAKFQESDLKHIFSLAFLSIHISMYFLQKKTHLFLHPLSEYAILFTITIYRDNKLQTTLCRGGNMSGLGKLGNESKTGLG